ncbi:MAG: DNA/RNA non-specific endonuclease [Bacteroidales bacterium]|nr:DNA/RNA non-specific endonuclease [Bacteroidales bacterium]
MRLASHRLWSLPLLLLLLSCHPRVGCGESTKRSAEGFEVPAYGTEEDIVRHIGYVASYNHQTLCPNWVAWELTAEETRGEVQKSRNFSRDPDVDFPKASREDYANSGWDKGHMAPHADMKWSLQALKESDYFTNICPQDHDMNNGAWKKIENLTRDMALVYDTVWVVCGPIYDRQPPLTIGEAEVHVPDRFFKAMVVRSRGCYHAVGFLMENTPQKAKPRSYAVSVDSVEAVIGRDLFPSLAEEVEAVVEWNVWNRKPNKK